jgi:hypothetical protein
VSRVRISQYDKGPNLSSTIEILAALWRYHRLRVIYQEERARPEDPDTKPFSVLNENVPPDMRGHQQQ